MAAAASGGQPAPLSIWHSQSRAPCSTLHGQLFGWWACRREASGKLLDGATSQGLLG